MNSIRAMSDNSEIEINSTSLSTNMQTFETISNQVGRPEILCKLTDPQVPSFILQYLYNRGYDPVELERDWDVVVGQPSWPIRQGEKPLQYPILVIPVYQYGNYWFWQGRLVPPDGTEDGELEKDSMGIEYPKYYIPKGAKKKWTLYNLDGMERFSEVCLVEGVTDVWRIGPRAGAMFGKVLSPAHVGVLRRRFAGKTIILVPDMNDPEALTEAYRNKQRLLEVHAFNDVLIAKIPVGKDPGSLRMNREELWEFIRSLAYSRDDDIIMNGGNPERR